MQLILLFMILESCVSLSSYRLLALAGLTLLVKGPELGQGSGDSAGQRKVRRRRRQELTSSATRTQPSAPHSPRMGISTRDPADVSHAGVSAPRKSYSCHKKTRAPEARYGVSATFLATTVGPLSGPDLNNRPRTATV